MRVIGFNTVKSLVNFTRKIPVHCERVNWFRRKLLFSHLVISSSLWPQGLQHTRLPCLSPSPRVFSNSSPLSQWHHPNISSSVTLFSCPQAFPEAVFSNESALNHHVAKVLSFSFSISPSNKCLTSFQGILMKNIQEPLFLAHVFDCHPPSSLSVLRI